MIDALQVIINGLLVGLVYGLVAVSFVVIYRSSRIVNLAQGEILLLGALFIWTFTLGVKLPWGIGVPIALICCVGMALILERALFRPLIGESPFTVFMASIALLILLRGVAQLVWGAETRPFPPILPSGAWSIGPFLVTKRLLIGAVLTVSLVELLHWFFMHTRQGLRLAAVAEDHYTALSLGVSVRQAVAVAWIMGALLSAVGSIVLLSDQIVSLNAAGIGLRALPIALLGRDGIRARRDARRRHHRRGRSAGVGLCRSVHQGRELADSALCDHDRRPVVSSARPLRLESHREAVTRHAAPDRRSLRKLRD
jgi:branched-chain amino acid transport system permease protein